MSQIPLLLDVPSFSHVLLSGAALPLPIPSPLRFCPTRRAPLLLPSIPGRAGVGPGVPWGAQTRQLQLLLFSFKCLHLFITKTPLRFPGSSTSWAGELSEETHGRHSSAKTPPKPAPGCHLGLEVQGAELGAWVGAVGWGQAGPFHVFGCFQSRSRHCRPPGSLAALTG